MTRHADVATSADVKSNIPALAGLAAHIGDPQEVGRKYLRLNFEGVHAAGAPDAAGSAETAGVRMLDARLVDAGGERVSSVEHGDEIRIQIEIEAREDFAALGVGYLLINADGVGVGAMRTVIGGERPRPVKAGERFKVETTATNHLGPGHYFVHCGINRVLEGGVALDVPSAIDFVVFGGAGDRGLVSLPQTSKTTVIEGGGG